MNPVKQIFIWAIRLYQLVISPILGKKCRFYPSCSCYSMQCIENLSIHRALWYSTLRIFKCHPFHSGGIDLPPIEKLESKD